MDETSQTSASSNADDALENARKFGRNRGTRALRLLPYEFGAVILLAAFAVLATAAMLELQTSATAYIVGEGQWSKAQQDAARNLQRYASSGDSEVLEKAREDLAVPLGDRAARLALDSDPPDIEAARVGFEQGRNAPIDVDRCIRPTTDPAPDSPVLPLARTRDWRGCIREYRTPVCHRAAQRVC